ncbi:MAG: aminotransferase class I/II-fold pyridoxal phosphate-dependent enzyme [Candidatus Hodarchaeota archaeon]
MRFDDWQPPKIEHGRLTQWNWIVYHPENLKLGNKVDIGAFSYLNAKAGIELGDDVQIGSHCSIYSVSTIDDKEAPVVLKKNARLGSHSTVLPGVTIGENTTVGAHSFINKDLPDNVVAFGTPARIYKKTKSDNKEIVEKWKIPLFKTYSDQDDIDAVTKVLQRGTYWACGPEIEEFEKTIANYVGTKYALSFNSGTSALHTLLLAYNFSSEDEVIVPSFTFIATANAVLLTGAKPIFAESEEETFGLNAEDVEKKINPKTKAIISLHYGGFPSRDIEKLREIADKHNLILIDDAAESLGAHINNKKIGTFGHSTIFSFCQNKILATGEGGMLVTNDQIVYEKAKLICSHGRVEKSQDYFSHTGDNDYIQAGYNYRMPTIIAALGLSQFKKIQKIIDLRRKHASYLSNQLSRITQINVPKELLDHFSVYQMYTIKLPDKETRDRLQKYLEKEKIMSKVYFYPVHLKTIYLKYGYHKGNLPKIEDLSDRVLNIPLYPSMVQSELDCLVKSIFDFFNFENEKRS